MKTIAIAALLGATNAHWLKELFHKHKHLKTMEGVDYMFMQHLVEYGITYGTRDEYEYRF